MHWTHDEQDYREADSDAGICSPYMLWNQTEVRRKSALETWQRRGVGNLERRLPSKVGYDYDYGTVVLASMVVGLMIGKGNGQ